MSPNILLGNTAGTKRVVGGNGEVCVREQRTQVNIITLLTFPSCKRREGLRFSLGGHSFIQKVLHLKSMSHRGAWTTTHKVREKKISAPNLSLHHRVSEKDWCYSVTLLKCFHLSAFLLALAFKKDCPINSTLCFFNICIH